MFAAISHHNLFKQQPQAKPRGSIIQPDYFVNIPAGAVIAPGTFSFFLQIVPADIFHGENKAHIGQPPHDPVKAGKENAEWTQQTGRSVNGKHKNRRMTGESRFPLSESVKGSHQYFHAPADSAAFDKIFT